MPNERLPSKALLIKQPYASRIVRGEMPLKWMPTNTKFRGTICICSTKAAANEEGEDDAKNPKEAALGTVDIVDTQKMGTKWTWITENPNEWIPPKQFKKKRARLWFNIEFE